MNFRRAGIILFTNDYEACVSFYSETLGLPVMFVLDEPGSHLTKPGELRRLATTNRTRHGSHNDRGPYRDDPRQAH